jgi:hypothetical protein
MNIRRFLDCFHSEISPNRYATGILLISPLGDLVRRRQLIIFLALISASLTIGLAITPNLVVFETLSFIIGVVSVTPQIMIVRPLYMLYFHKQ